MPGPLIAASYVALIRGSALTTDENTRATDLIPIASNLVRGKLKMDVSSTTAPEAAKIAVARLVLSVIDRDSADLRAEQIGDYRAEYQRANGVQLMDLSIVEDLLRDVKVSSRSIRVNLPFDGVTA